MGTNHSRHCEKISMSDEDLLARLATAAYKGCERDLKNLLKAGAFRFIDDFTMRGKSALHNAARSGQCSCVKILLEHNAYVNIASYDRRTPLMEAAEQGYTECLIMLLNYGADPNTVSTDQMTALHYAARNGHSDCVEKLLQSGSNVNAIASGGWTSLHFAARHAHSTCVKLLLQYNAQVEPPTTKRVSSYVVYVYFYKFMSFNVSLYAAHENSLGVRGKNELVVTIQVSIIAYFNPDVVAFFASFVLNTHRRLFRADLRVCMFELPSCLIKYRLY